MDVNGVAVPPDADTRLRGELKLEENTMTPSRLHAPPALYELPDGVGTSHTVWSAVPETEILFNF
jgi:hypothetical protein